MMNIGTAYTVAVNGFSTHIVTVQGFVSSGLPYFSLVGMPDSVVGQARERVKSACKSTKFHWPQTRVTVNLSPASLPKHGAGFDLAIAVSILASSRVVNPCVLEKSVFAGELALDGSVLPIPYALDVAQCAKDNGFTTVYVPSANAQEAQLVDDITVQEVHHINQLLTLLGAPPSLVNSYNRKSALHVFADKTTSSHVSEESLPEYVVYEANSSSLDFGDIAGQEDAKFGLLVAAAGGHHCLMTGPAGTGKSMLAQRLASIIPKLNKAESIEVARIRSARRIYTEKLLNPIVPFVSIHHSATVNALTGGMDGGYPTPGAMSLAHRGILFLDEAPQFSRQALQALRTPLDSGLVTISRVKAHISYPAQFMLVLAQNPCPCGNLWSSTKNCDCTPVEKRRYTQKISQPLSDRIDIKLKVLHDSFAPLNSHSSDSYSPLFGGHMNWDSSHMRELVRLARERSKKRYAGLAWHTNAQASGQWLMQNTPPLLVSELNILVRDEELSMRSAHKILRLSWSLADLFGRAAPEKDDLRLAEDLYLAH